MDIPERPAASASAELLALGGDAGGYGAILADPPWRFANRTGKMAPEHRRLARWTLPLWLWVSITGVVIYFMLY